MENERQADGMAVKAGKKSYLVVCYAGFFDGVALILELYAGFWPKNQNKMPVTMARPA
ncbi:hypothetical protein [Serratia entomophila]|uniref:hypothetical protein n=1 Tax=Serratia entomophila TaxID=42906 RepID=UPI0021B7B26A|nr:hypothetical protein [Serratia entomophila]